MSLHWNRAFDYYYLVTDDVSISLPRDQGPVIVDGANQATASGDGIPNIDTLAERIALLKRKIEQEKEVAKRLRFEIALLERYKNTPAHYAEEAYEQGKITDTTRLARTKSDWCYRCDRRYCACDSTSEKTNEKRADDNCDNRAPHLAASMNDLVSFITSLEDDLERAIRVRRFEERQIALLERYTKTPAIHAVEAYNRGDIEDTSRLVNPIKPPKPKEYAKPGEGFCHICERWQCRCAWS